MQGTLGKPASKAIFCASQRVSPDTTVSKRVSLLGREIDVSVWALRYLDCRASIWKMIVELGRIWRQSALA
jgi:hypothetical protein